MKKEDNAFVLRYLGNFDGININAKELLTPYLKMFYSELRKIRFSVSNYPNWLSCHRGKKYCLTDFIFTNFSQEENDNQ